MPALEYVVAYLIYQTNQAGGRMNKVFNQFPVCPAMLLQSISVHIHELNYKIDPAAWSFGILISHYLFLSEDRHTVFNNKVAPVVAVCNYSAAYYEPLIRF